jgi:thioredoxin 1
MIRFTDDTFEAEVLGSSLPVLVDFGAPWCGPCRVLDPMVEELAVEFEGRLKVGKLDTADSPVTAATFGVRSLPTVMIFKNGEVVEQIIGLVPRAKLVAALDNHLTAVS